MGYPPSLSKGRLGEKKVRPEQGVSLGQGGGRNRLILKTPGRVRPAHPPPSTWGSQKKKRRSLGVRSFLFPVWGKKNGMKSSFLGRHDGSGGYLNLNKADIFLKKKR